MIDGPVLTKDALDAGMALDAVFVEAAALSSRLEIKAVVERANGAGADVWELPPGALGRLTDVVHPPGIAAIARWAPAELSVAAPGSLVLVLAGVADPGNAGTLLRTAEASGASAVVFCGGAVDPTNPKCVRASAGAFFRTAVVVRDSVADLLDDLAVLGYRRIATEAAASRPYHDIDLTGPVAIVLGTEAHGLPAGLESRVDDVVVIPMAGRSESLNVAMAGSIICFEALRQRRAV